MNETNQNQNNASGPWWKPAMQVFSEISVWIIVPVILAVIGGEFFDTRFDSKPTMLIVLVIMSFIISAFGIVRTVRKYSERLKEQMNKK